MSRHSFDPEIAAKVGLAAAVIYQNIAWWCEKNAANEKHVYEGRAWTYNTVNAFGTLFPYLTAKQIRTALEVLRDAGLILTGNFNADSRDRTLWYAISGQEHLPCKANVVAPQGTALPDSKPSVVNDINPTLSGQGALFEKGMAENKPETNAFDEFWDAYPSSPRKTDKPKARTAFWAICHGKHKGIPKTDPKVVIEGARRYRDSRPDAQFVPLPTTWLNGARWEQAVAAPERRQAWRGEVVR